MEPIKFGAFLAPHHPIGENPVLQYRRDLALVAAVVWSAYDLPYLGKMFDAEFPAR